MSPSGDRLRANLAGRDGNHCHYCLKDDPTFRDGRNNEFRFFTLDHVIPKSQGGTRVQANLVLSCYRCNHRRGDIPYLDYAIEVGVEQEVRMLTWKRAVEAHAVIRGVWFPALQQNGAT